MIVNITSPSGGRNWVCDPKSVAAVDEGYRRARGITGLKRTEQACMVIDAGGAVLVGEEDIQVEAGGIKIQTPVSQFEDVWLALRDSKESKMFPGSIKIGGWMDYYFVIALETRDALVKEMERMWPEVEPKAQAEMDHWKNIHSK